jgi:Homing endonuclease associated repeat
VIETSRGAAPARLRPASEPSTARTSAVDLFVHLFGVLEAEEQEQAYVRISDLRLVQLAELGGETAVFVAAMRRFADLADGELTAERYRAVQRQEAREGRELPSLSAVIRFFGSFALAKEAVRLSDVSSARKIEARFRARVTGRGPHFSADEVRAALAACVAELGRVPLVAEYDEWRTKELALKRARGEVARVPSPTVFRRRHRTWERALLAHGYSPDEVHVRLEPKPERLQRLVKVDRYSEDTLRDTLLRCVADLGHVPLIAEFSAWRERELKRTRARKVLLPTDSPYRYRYGTWERALLHFGFSEAKVRARLDAGRRRSTAATRPHRFQGTK